MAKKVIYREEARRALAAGVSKVADAVRITLGPKGRAVVFNRGVGPIFSLDGVTVAKQIELADEAEADGVELVKAVARETDRAAGDGTTTATILVQSILDQGLRALGLGVDHVGMKAGIDRALETAKKEIAAQAKPVRSRKDVADVATISSRDPEVGECVAGIVDKLGKNAVITVEESKIFGLHNEVVNGMRFEKGYASPWFMTNQERAEAVLEKPLVLVASQVISTNEDVVKILNEVLMSGAKSLLVVADQVKGEALATMILNKIGNRLLVVAVQAPGFGDDKMERLRDIAAVVGATAIEEEAGRKVEDAELKDLGRAERVIVTKDSTTIVGGKGGQAVKKRIAFLKGEIAREKSEYRREQAEGRLAAISGGVAVIRVGTISEEENAEKRYRVEDAVKSAKSAAEEGIVPGGGMALWRAAAKIGLEAEGEKNLAVRAGLKIVEEAIRAPARQIVDNAGAKGDVVLAEADRTGKGYDSSAHKFVDLVSAGIIDPAKVVRVALENAVSAASMFLITGAVIVEDEEKAEKKRKEE
jgi:chaperonin GroEL